MRKKVNPLIVRRILWLLLWILSVVTISFYGGAVSDGLFYGVTMLPVVSFGYLLLVYYNFRMYQTLESRETTAGKRTRYYFILKNECWIPFAGVRVKLHSDFSYVENMNEDTEYELLKGMEYSYETYVVCKYRGEYQVGLKEIIITDFLRLFELHYKPKSNIRAIVRPTVTKARYIESIEHIFAMVEKTNVHTNVSKDVLVRDYVTGDSLRQISWKMSAKENKLMVRQEIGEEKQGVVLVGDTKRYYLDEADYIPVEHKMLEVLGAVGYYLADQHIRHTFCCTQTKEIVFDIDALSGFQNFYQILCGIRFDEEYDFAHYVWTLLYRGFFCDSKVVFFVLHRLNRETIQIAEQLTNMGIVVVMYVISNETYRDYLQFVNDKLKIVILPTDANIEERL